MARFILLTAVYGAPSGQPQRYGRGTIICDSAANQLWTGLPPQTQDIIWPALCAAGDGTTMAPLDAAASAQMLGVAITTLAQVAAQQSGSVGAGQA